MNRDARWTPDASNATPRRRARAGARAARDARAIVIGARAMGEDDVDATRVAEWDLLEKSMRASDATRGAAAAAPRASNAKANAKADVEASRRRRRDGEDDYGERSGGEEEDETRIGRDADETIDARANAGDGRGRGRAKAKTEGEGGRGDGRDRGRETARGCRRPNAKRNGRGSDKSERRIVSAESWRSSIEIRGRCS